MFKIGLKLFSTNNYYLTSAKELYREGVYDFIELLPVPGSYRQTLGWWKELDIPFVIHAPHFSFGVNLGRADLHEKNAHIIKESLQFADALEARYVICHPGAESDIEETARQLFAFNDKRILVENKPFSTNDRKHKFNGASFEEISFIIERSKVGFCLDISHCIASATAVNKDWLEYLFLFSSLNPSIYHVSDGFTNSGIDTHEHIGKGDFDWDKILPFIPQNAWVTLETAKDSKENLDDFAKDVQAFQKLALRKID